MLGNYPLSYDFMFDMLLYGLRKNGHDVYDYPKRLPLYNNGRFINYWGKGKFPSGILGLDSHNRTGIPDPCEFDVIIAENAMLLSDKMVWWNDKEAFQKKCLSHSGLISLITNDPFTNAPIPATYIKEGKYAVRENGIRPTVLENCFNLTFMCPRAWCHAPLNGRVKDMSVSFTPSNHLRKDLIKTYPINLWTNDLNTYLNGLQEYMFGLSLPGDGWLCQRDPEVAGNGVLLRYKQPKTLDFPEQYHHGEDCVDFTDINEIPKILAYYKANPDEWKRMALKSYEKTVQYHTAEAESERLLKYVLH